MGRAEDVVSALGLDLAERSVAGAPLDLSPLEAAMVAELARLGPSSIDELARTLGAPVPEVLSALTGLEVRGALAVEGAGYFRLSREAAGWRSHNVRELDRRSR
jgi:predicted Rossmann fold nucleotide-binding protein DprA/Smf involved in DNA uptake